MTGNGPIVEQEAADAFVQRLTGEWTAQDQTVLEARLDQDLAYADAYRRVAESWAALDTHAEAPELMAYREEAISYARRTSARRWLRPNLYARGRWRVAAAILGVMVTSAVVWQFSPYGYSPGRYRTGIGEQRIVELEDHTRIALDAATRLQVRYSDDARVVQLKEGQAQFSVAKDPARPFKVRVGEHTIVALGTVFTVEYVDQEVHVAMMEGRVAVIADQAAPTPSAATRPKSTHGQDPSIAENRTEPSNTAVRGTIELSAGEELRVHGDGLATVIPEADLKAATAWREGKVIFRGETLEQAIRRLNRYSHVRIEIADASLAAERISGVFEAGDTQGFVSAVQRYLPVTVQQTDSTTIEMRTKL
jgi:transmembrane sensor